MPNNRKRSTDVGHDLRVAAMDHASGEPVGRSSLRVRDLLWGLLAAVFALFFSISFVETIIEIGQRSWSGVAAAPVALLIFFLIARTAWRRTLWGARRRKANISNTRAQGRVDLGAFRLFVPNGYESYLRRRAGADLQVALRSIVLVLSIAFVFFGLILATMGGLPNGAVMPWLGILTVLAASTFTTDHLLSSQPVDCSSDDALAASYVSFVCTRLALVSGVALMGFTFAVVGGPVWIYFAGAAFAVVRMWTGIAPSRRTLTRDQQRIAEDGCERSLADALRRTPPPPENDEGEGASGPGEST